MEERKLNLDRVVTVEVGDRRRAALVEVEVPQRRVVKAEGEGHLRGAVEVEEGRTLLEH